MSHAATKHFAIIDVTITDDFIDRRTKAATTTAVRWRKLSNAASALGKASMLADAIVSAAAGGPVPAALRQEVGTDIQKHGPAHDPADVSRDFEVAVVAAVAAIIVLDGTAQRTEYCTVFAEALSAAMDMSAAKVPPRVAALWEDLALAARSMSDDVAERRRDRQPVDTADTAGALRALAANSRKDAEEIDTLWWALNDWSTLAEASLSKLPPPEGVVVAATELSHLLAWPAVRAHRQLAHRNLSDRYGQIALSELGVERALLRARIDSALAPLETLVTEHPRVFVALTAAMAATPALAAARLDAAQIDGSQSATAWNWCERLVRELSLASSAGAKPGPLE
jgi:hypothetical protein